MRQLLMLGVLLLSGPAARAAEPDRLLDIFGSRTGIAPFAAALNDGALDVDALAYALDLELADGTPGSERYRSRFEGLFLVKCGMDTLALDFHEGRNTVSAVRVDGRPAAFTHAAGKLNITLPRGGRGRRLVLVSVEYAGAFQQVTPAVPASDRHGLMVEPPTDLHPQRLFFTFTWPNFAREWLPARDHPRDGVMFALRATFPADLKVLGNGNLVSEVDHGDGTRATTWVALTPMPTYGLFFGAYGDWTELDLGHHRGRALTAHLYADHADGVAPAFADTGVQLDYLAGRFGPFRWGRLDLVEDPLPFFGGMENPTVISLSDGILATQQVDFARELRIHETSHHWCGNLVRLASWNDFWLSEGCANYMAGRFFRDHGDPEAARRYWGSQLRRALLFDGLFFNPPLHALRPPDPELPDAGNIVDGISYQKGAWILHMLEDRLGTERFNRTLRAWFTGRAFQAASTRDFQAQVERSGGMTPAAVAAFFDQWVYGTGFPAFNLSWQHDPSRRELTVTLQQVQPWGPADGYHLPLELEVAHASGGRRRLPVEVSSRSTTVTAAADAPPATVVVDPDQVRYLGVTCGEGLPACRTGYSCRVPPADGSPRPSICVPNP
jgi:aminopeptidase N